MIQESHGLQIARYVLLMAVPLIASAPAGAQDVTGTLSRAQPVYEFRNGQWFDGSAHLRDLGIFSNLRLLKIWVEETPGTIFPHRLIGRLTPGYEASFLVLERNPLDDFSAVREIRLRVKQGVILNL